MRRATLSGPRTIRARLLRILVLSLVLLLTLLGISAGQQIGGYRNAAATAQNARLEVTLQGLVHELQKERGLTTGYVGGVGQFRARIPAQRTATDTARTVLEQALTGRDDPAARSVRDEMSRLDGLAGIRSSADNGSGKVAETFDYFTSTITVLNRLGLGLDDVRDGRLRKDYQALQVLGNSKEFMGEERAIVLGSVRAGRFRGDDYSRFMEIRSGRLAALESFPQSATAAQQHRLAGALATPDAVRALGFESVAVHGGGKLSERDLAAMDWWTAMTSAINGLRTVQISIGADIKDRADTLEGDALQQLLIFALVAVGAVAALGGLALGCVRSVSGPLDSLARQARDVAGSRLPQAVARVQSAGGDRPQPPAPLSLPVRTGEEVKLVADAFDQVQRAAFDLATEQAVLRRNATDSLVSLGRRNQNLVRRQISFINKLEHEDADPATLANLFELDHLATRMRRNAESLLVLAGESSPRTWATPLTVTDVLRAALSEVEEYRRVTLRRVEPAHISGSVVSEIAHLLAELVENALSFSPPDSDVEVEGRRTSAGYLIAIVDHGFGMDAQGLAEANVRLSGTASFMAEPTRFLGHFVVGALARKCGIEVRLGEAPAAGVVARVLIPATLLAEETAAVVPGPRTEDSAAPGPVTRPAAPEKAVKPVKPAKDERPAASNGAARTRNGLVKRPKRSGIPSAVSESEAPRWQQDAEPTPDRSPEEISGMLSTLRSSHLRGGISVEKEKEKAEKAEKTEKADRAEKDSAK
ncbi:sensor histidine kinase [Streptomyces beijiangensis]|uniref:histidine kinase n=2 Tax=Streptomyces beijiangensis TaxID=163361 RepID=A0A939JIA9_9ACTN|nr:ATP-binding protein [Streptomyces beijiangensis]MBO0517111.1 nitrate- and nitrite sensing domain-containing protein [Streptomyces beijiangensis]